MTFDRLTCWGVCLRGSQCNGIKQIWGKRAALAMNTENSLALNLIQILRVCRLWGTDLKRARILQDACDSVPYLSWKEHRIIFAFSLSVYMAPAMSRALC